MKSILLTKEKLITTGDMNIHVDDPNDIGACQFLDLLVSLGVQQHVNQQTHIHGHTLDLIITRRPENIIHDPPQIDRYPCINLV